MALVRRPDPDRSPEVEPRRARHMGLLAILLVTLIWRLPSFFDPPWVNDEGTYFAVAQAMAHGYRLYGDVWENKPPALYLLYEAVYHSLGPSLIAIRLLAALAVLGSVLLTTAVARVYVSAGWARLAGLLAGLLLGVPFLEGTTGNAEVFLIVCTLGAVLLALRGRIVPAAALMAAAALLKVVALFDAAALGLLLLGYCGGAGGAQSAVSRLGRAALYAAVLGTLLGASLVLAAVAGILRPMLQDAVLYPMGYVGHANGGGVPWLILLKLAALAGGTLLLRGRPFPFLWLLWAAMGALISGRFFGHYALQPLPALCVSASIVLSAALPTVWERRLAIVVPALFVSLAAGCELAGWSLVASGHDTILARRLQWYVNFVRMATHSESYATYRNQVDDHVTRNILIAQDLRALPPGKLLIWGNIPWVYVLSDRLPATPYTSALRQPEVPGETATLRRAVARGRSSALVVVFPPLPPLAGVRQALGGRYVEVRRVRDAALYAERARPGPRRGR